MVACGSGIPDGTFIPTDENAPYTSLRFTGARLTIGFKNETTSTGQYQFNNNRVSLRGNIFDIEVQNNDRLKITLDGESFIFVRE
jgi:hypothetical protein